MAKRCYTLLWLLVIQFYYSQVLTGTKHQLIKCGTIKYLPFTGDEELARLLVHNGADYTIKNKQGQSANDIAKEKGIHRNENWNSNFRKTITITEELFAFFRFH